MFILLYPSSWSNFSLWMRPKSFNMLCMSIWIVRVYEVYGMIHCSMFNPCDLSQCSFIRSPLISDHNRSRQHIVLYYLKKRSSIFTSYRNEKGFLEPLSIPPTYHWPVVWLPRLYLARKKRLSSISTTLGIPNSSRPPNLWLFVITSSIMRSLHSQPYILAVFRSIARSFAISRKEPRLIYL
jgi:hypothetical protein